MSRYLYLFLEHLAIPPLTLHCLLACRFMLVGKGIHEDRDSPSPLIIRQTQRIGNPFLNRRNLQPRCTVQTLADDSGDRHDGKYLKDKKSSTKLRRSLDSSFLLSFKPFAGRHLQHLLFSLRFGQQVLNHGIHKKCLTKSKKQQLLPLLQNNLITADFILTLLRRRLRILLLLETSLVQLLLDVISLLHWKNGQ